MQEAPIYLMDEPFVGVDMLSEKAIIQVLRELRNQKKTIIAVHHDLNTVKEYFDWTLMINKSSISCGPIEQSFTPEHIQNTYKHHIFLRRHRQHHDNFRLYASTGNYWHDTAWHHGRHFKLFCIFAQTKLAG